VGNYFAFAGAGEINRAAIGLLDSYLPQDDVEIIVPQTMEARGLIELYNWLNVEFTGIDTTSDIVDHAHMMDISEADEAVIILLRDAEHPEEELLRDAHNVGLTVLDLNDSLHPIEWKPPDTVPSRAGGRRRKAEQAQQDAMDSYQKASNEIRDLQEAADRQDNMANHAHVAEAEQEETGVNAEIEGPATISLPGIHIHERPTGLIEGATWLGEGKALGSSLHLEEDGTPVWDERFPRTDEDMDKYLGSMAEMDQAEEAFFGTLRVLIRQLVAQEVKMIMSMTPGVRATTEQFVQTPPVMETTEIEDPKAEKFPYVFTKETGRYAARGNKRGRPKSGTEIIYLTQKHVDELGRKGLIDDLLILEEQLELPFD
jgi:hypothetical protein